MSTLRVAAINNPSASSGGLAISASGNVTGAGLDLITTQSFSAVSSVSVNNCFSATYENYRVVMLVTESVVAASYIRLRAGGADISASNYWYGTSVALSSGAAITTNAGASQAQFDLYGGAVGGGMRCIDIGAPNLAAPTRLAWSTSLSNGTNIVGAFAGGLYTLNTIADGFTYYPVSGTTTGTLRVYGYRN